MGKRKQTEGPTGWVPIRPATPRRLGRPLRIGLVTRAEFRDYQLTFSRLTLLCWSMRPRIFSQDRVDASRRVRRLLDGQNHVNLLVAEALLPAQVENIPGPILLIGCEEYHSVPLGRLNPPFLVKVEKRRNVGQQTCCNPRNLSIARHNHPPCAVHTTAVSSADRASCYTSSPGRLCRDLA